MTLTLGDGPLGGRPGGTFNFELDGAPQHRIYFQDYPRRLRAVIGGRVVLDSIRGRLLHETGIPPVPYLPLEDFAADLLERTDHSTHCPFKGDASYWTIRVGDRVEENAVWTYEDPKPEAAWLRGYAAVYWDKADRWLLEEEPVFGHLRDPVHRVDVHESSRPVTVTAGGTVVARSDRPKLRFETGLPPRVYVPAADLAPGVLSAAATRTVSPYKGEATYWSLPDAEDAAWSYEAPLPEAIKVQGHVSFLHDDVQVELGSPRSHWPADPPPAP